MNVLVLCEVLHPQTTGGAGRVAREVAAALGRSGVRIHFLTRATADSGSFSDGIPTTYFPPPGLTAMVTLRRIFRKTIRSFEPDLVHVHQPLPAFLAIPRNFSAPVVYTFHSAWPEELKIKASRWPRFARAPVAPVFQAIERRVVRSAAVVVTLSEFSRGEVQRLYGRDSIIIPGGVDTTRFKPMPVRRELGLVQLITVRNLVPRMGLKELIRAMPDVPKHAHLRIAGEGPLRPELQDLVRALGLKDRVELMGRIPETDLPAFYAGADYFILPTVALEGFGLVILESLACGTPVLGARVGAIPELLNCFDPSWVIGPPTPDAISNAIRRVLDNPAPDRQQLHDRISTAFDWQQIGECYRRLFESVVQKGGRGRA